MRKKFAELIQRHAAEDESIVFLTGDLGYNALESLQQSMGERFINAGVAEQNMVGMAAGMARSGYKVFCYSIAPFVVYRCLEQTRNDVCLHNLPVFLVGNGGGYGYGIMGSSHHALEDIACLAPLQNMSCHVPALLEDLESAIDTIVKEARPAYLRMGLGKPAPAPLVQLDAFRAVHQCDEPRQTLIAMGPLVNNVLEAMQLSGASRKTDLFTAVRFPFNSIPETLIESIRKSKRIILLEEHVAQGGLAQQFLYHFTKLNIATDRILTLHAQGYPGQLYGDQAFHQKQSGLDVQSIVHHLSTL